MDPTPSRLELEAAQCWEADDEIRNRPAMTAFRRRTRYHQAQWREAHGHPIGTQPIRPKPGQLVRLVGSRLPLAYAEESGATFLTDGALTAARARTATIEPHQTFDRQRLWADLLWSETLAFNLFGDLASDLPLADRAVHAWWPETPGVVRDVRFVHSPGRLDPAFLGSLRAFDAALGVDLRDGTKGVVAVDVNYHERAKAEIPKPGNLRRYRQVAEHSGAFRRGSLDWVEGRSDLTVMWLEHLLLLSMLQHESGSWTWGRYVVIHPAANSDVGGLCDRYRSLLADPTTFSSMTLESLLEGDVLPASAAAALRERYLPT